MHLITLTTDFGTRDGFAGTMKGVVIGINPSATVVDLTHEIPPGDIRAGAFVLMAACRYFPKGAVHVAVVDPGVGSRRRAIAVQTANGWFVGPDNGLLSWALARERIRTIRQLENARYFLEPVSRTFHGRDVFAPVAAHLSRGVAAARLGRGLKDFLRLPWPEPARRGQEIRGAIVYVDHFGNAITNIDAALLPVDEKAACEVAGKRKLRCGLAAFYGAVPVGRPVALMGSSGFLEIAVNGRSAARRYGLKTGDAVMVRPWKP